jgi:hypothetical protein
LAQLFGKGVAVEQTATLDGPKDSPYHVVGDDNNYAVVWGPFTGKKIQVALYWINSSGNGLQPIDKNEIKDVCGSFTFLLDIIKRAFIGCVWFSDDKLRTKVTLVGILIFHGFKYVLNQLFI